MYYFMSVHLAAAHHCMVVAQNAGAKTKIHSLLLDTLPSDALPVYWSLDPRIDHEVSEFEDL